MAESSGVRRHVSPEVPMKLEVRGDRAWSIDILRRWCPDEIT